MATFKVGQRVRIVARREIRHSGVETIVTSAPFYFRGDECYHTEYSTRVGRNGIVASALEPLTPPSSDTLAAQKFLSRLREMKPDADVQKEGVVEIIVDGEKRLVALGALRRPA